MKTKYNIDKLRICLKQPEKFYQNLQQEINQEGELLIKDGYYLSFNPSKVNDKDITAELYIIDKVKIDLGTFTFNHSQKYGSKCFFNFSTKSLYRTNQVVFEGKEKGNVAYNYFNCPFYVFEHLGLKFNNITYIEIACDTEASVINKIQYAVSHPERLDMILCWKKVADPEEILDEYGEYYQRSRLRKATRPTIYVHPVRYEAGNHRELKIYDKAREMVQSRPDKEELVRSWNDMDKEIQRIEVRVENKQFKRYFNQFCEKNDLSNIQMEEFFYDLGMNEELRKGMFSYFTDKLLHFKLRNHDKTQITITDIANNSLTALKELVK